MSYRDRRSETPRECPGCGRELRTIRESCLYCGAKLPSIRGTLPPPPPEDAFETLPCPICPAEPLKPAEVDGTAIRTCGSCRGVFVDRLGFDYLVRGRARDVEPFVGRSKPELFQSVRRQAPNDTTRYIACPACGKMMSRRAHSRISGILVDQCMEHGTWLDGGELEKLFEFIDTGGEKLAALVEQTKRKP